MKEFLAVFIGGGLGSVIRFGLGKFLTSQFSTAFPAGTFIVNVLACLLLGILIGLTESKFLISPVYRLFWAVGFCGGFSTFSTFSAETLSLLQKNQLSLSGLYIIGSVIICLIATFSGQFLATKL